MTCSTDTSTRAGLAYLRRLFTAMAAYTVVLVATIFVLNNFGDEPWRYAMVVLPVVLLFVAQAVARLLREADELQQRILLESLAFALGAGSLLTVTYGFLQLAGLPEVSWLWVWPVYGAMWLLGSALARRRY